MRRFISVLLLLSIAMSGKAMAETSVVSQPEDSSWGLAILLAGSLVILVLLVLWLLKNSYRLKESNDNVDTDGKNWVNSHLKDLDSQQVNLLIKRQHAMHKQPLRVENQNKQ